MPPGVGIGVARLMSEGYKQGKSMKTRLEEMYPTLVTNLPPNYGRQRLSNLLCRDKHLVPTKTLEKEKAVVANANRKRLDDANAGTAKEAWQDFKTAKLAEYKANSEYDSVLQHKKESPFNPNARRLTAEELDKQREWGRTSKAKYNAARRKVKKTKKAAKSKEHADKDDPSANNASLASNNDNSEDEDARFDVRGNFAPGPDKLLRVQRERYIEIEGSGEEEGDTEVDDEDAQDGKAARSHEQRDKSARPAKRAKANRDPKGKGRAADANGDDRNDDDNGDKEGGSIGAGSNEPCPEEPDVRLAVLEDDAIDQLADHAGGRTALMRTRSGKLTHASPIPVSTSLLASSSATTMRVVGRLRGSTIRNVSLYAPTSAIAKDVLSRLPNGTEVLVNLVSTAAETVDLPVRHIGNECGRWELFGSGTGGVITVWTRLVVRQGSYSFRTETTVAFDGTVIDVASVCRAFEGTGVKLGFTRKITSHAVAVKRTSRARRTLNPQQQHALDESITKRDSAASPYAVKHAPVHTALKEAWTMLDANTTAQEVRVAKEGAFGTVVVNRVRPQKPDQAFGQTTVYWRQALPNGWAVADAAPDTLVVSKAKYDGAARVLHARDVFSMLLDAQAAVLWLTGRRMAANKVGKVDVPLSKGALSSARTLLHHTEPAQQILMAQSIASRSSFKGDMMFGLIYLPLRAYSYHLLVSSVLTLARFGGSFAYSRGALVHRPTPAEHNGRPGRSKTSSALARVVQRATSAARHTRCIPDSSFKLTLPQIVAPTPALKAVLRHSLWLSSGPSANAVVTKMLKETPSTLQLHVTPDGRVLALQGQAKIQLLSFFPAAKLAPQHIKLWGLLVLKYTLSKWELSLSTKREIERRLA
ncbi:hypothetical protein Rhopal_003868-T1 [Rhodotorula paludigena]|uniref:Uncharacterized protein n=1 Tax=Rhodotorula paludigena TaxID=86838 RepID=A0AAV5GLS1_9BASI|nr:hypothetical protein Rhopal_003868-T1 [Rhodotorula paludigena]